MWVIFGYEEQTFFSKRVTGCLLENTGNYNKLLCSVLLFVNTKNTRHKKDVKAWKFKFNFVVDYSYQNEVEAHPNSVRNICFLYYYTK